jgi:hypothetical protein
MTDVKAEEGVDRLVPPAATEAQILECNEGRQAALKEVDDAAAQKEEKKEEEVKLPKLSAADFRVYNSMAEHMEYFVRLALSVHYATK